MEKRLEVGAGAEDEGVDVIVALFCGLLRLKKLVEEALVVGAVVDEVVVGWLPRENKLGAAAAEDDPVSDEDAGEDDLGKLKAGATAAPELPGTLDNGVTEEPVDA